jgi:GTP pyrophosphokinase
MHENAELGVAAHWKYKEGNDGANKAFEERVNWLRKLITWQEEDESGDLVEELRSQVFDDRVYVSTPKGDVVDLPYGATPLDFAYYVHTNIGHRSTGAKIDGRIVPFTYKLQNGDRVEVLTGKKLNPSRDWMNPSLGYVHSSRARAKIHSWFKQQDKDKNRVAGKEMLEAELSKQHLPVKSAEQALTRFDMSSLDDLYAAIGGGYLRIVQVVNYLTQLHQPEPEIHAKLKTRKRATKPSDTVVVEGVGNLMSQIARCCSPVPGDPIVGYITLGKGVSVHRTHCEQLRHMLKQHPEREIEVSWEQETAASFAVQLNVFTADRDGVLRDITTLLATERAGLLGVHSMSNPKDNTAKIKLQLEVKDLGALSKLTHKLQLIRGVVKVERQDG